MTTVYDTLGVNYTATRRPDPRIAAAIANALGDAVSVVNVGAGTGSYEPRDRRVVAVEPSSIMIRARAVDAPPAIRAAAEALPLADASVDAAMAVLTMHHWDDVARGLAEMRRVSRRRVVIFTWDRRVWETFWLVRDYLPIIVAPDRTRAVPIARIESLLGPCAIRAVLIPHDCVDGFHGAFWRRPQAYLDPRVRAGISSYAYLPTDIVDAALGRLASDLESGAWEARHGDLLTRDELDLGYRLIVAESARVQA